MAAIRKAPAVEEQEIEILSADQVASVLDGLRDHWLHPIASLALATGMRRGELLALQWSDIDLDGANLQVERSIEETRSGLRVKPPKTKRGRRNIDFASGSGRHASRPQKEADRIAACVRAGRQPTLVLSTVEGGLMSPDNFSRDWVRL